MLLVGWLTAMTEHHVLEEQLRRQTFDGSLTAWANGVTLMDHLSEALAGAEGRGGLQATGGARAELRAKRSSSRRASPASSARASGDRLEDVLRDADIAMHQAKSARRSSY